jgi:hypothetical protein
MFNNTGNKYAEKWTAEVVMDTLMQIDAIARKEETTYLHAALLHLQISRRAWSYWKEKFADDEAIMDQIDLIEMRFEKRLFEGALISKVPATMAIFALKNNHHWTDRPEALWAQPALPAPPMLIQLEGYQVIAIP